VYLPDARRREPLLGVHCATLAVSFQDRRNRRILVRRLLTFAQASPQAACGSPRGPPQKHIAGDFGNAVMTNATDAPGNDAEVVGLLGTVGRICVTRVQRAHVGTGGRFLRIGPNPLNLAACGPGLRWAPPPPREPRHRRTARPTPRGLEHSCHAALHIHPWPPRPGPGRFHLGQLGPNPACVLHFAPRQGLRSSPAPKDSAATASDPNSAAIHLISNAANCDSRPRTSLADDATPGGNHSRVHLGCGKACCFASTLLSLVY
jgi:hypothetical protein